MELKQLTIGDTELAVSELCLGCLPFGPKITGRDVDDLINVFRDGGGNFFDTAHCYSCWHPCGDGVSEKALGDYIKTNDCRDSVVIATKGGYPGMDNYRKVDSYLSSGRIAADIDDSLGRLKIDVIDLYWLHRDDPRMSVEEILETLNAEVTRGRIRYFGGSNWTSSRLAEANTYANEHGLDGFVASQPLWNLLEQKDMAEAHRLEPGVLLHVNEEDRRWHSDSQLPVLPFTPAARGFFSMEGNAPEDYITEENTARAGRVMKLASELGATPGQVALAWLQAQPFPVIPILGTSDRAHLKDALGTADVVLSESQASWLETGE